ncbi:MAG: GNAT family N-acetyltransferase [Kineosporiaceae bacterium]|nr:GNAT family N-acetyltransferase [Kineosporiaceae bacterium]MBK7621590.1 GNAT family N-acetyltransferase [Kineosporiaceae bacterium]MBK8077244.1 GNAT family N-acetyltransferase [Kineosporiaceae bacterium]
MALVRTSRRGSALLIGLHRPDKHNALDEVMVAEIDRALTEASREPCVVIVHSTTPGIFAAGADIAELIERDADAALRAINAGLFDRLEAHRWPTIALVDGPALGGGCELALACDLRLVSTRARFGQPELGLGILAGAGGNWRLAQAAGLPVARRMLYTGQVLQAAEAVEAGLADAVHPPEDLMDAGLAMAETVAARSWRALELTKLALRMHRPATTGFDLAAQALLFESQDKRDRMGRFLTQRAERSAAPTPAEASATAARSTAAPAGGAPSNGTAKAPVPPFHLRQLTIEDGLDLAASPQPGAWQVYDAMQPFPADEGYRAVVDSEGSLLGYCCLGEAARVPGAGGTPVVLDVAIGIRPQLSGKGWGAALGRAAIEYARSVAADRRLRTTVPEWNTVGLRVAEQSGFTPVTTVTHDRKRYVVLESSGAQEPVAQHPSTEQSPRSAAPRPA